MFLLIKETLHIYRKMKSIPKKIKNISHFIIEILAYLPIVFFLYNLLYNIYITYM